MPIDAPSGFADALVLVDAGERLRGVLAAEPFAADGPIDSAHLALLL